MQAIMLVSQHKLKGGIRQEVKFLKDLLAAERRRLTYLEIKFEGKSYIVKQEMWDAMNAQAAERGMTIDEYISEAFTLLKERDGKFKPTE